MPPANLRQWRSIVVAFICVAAIAAGNVAYTNYVQQRSDRRDAEQQFQADQRWCSLLGTLTGVYQRNPPPTDDGRRVAAAIARQYAQLGCPPPPPPDR